ncbi:PREDICTED: lipid transfer-like protein VAS [Nelumbo nucifera]|uniref:Bifunctional inhibitor/plant lipid transfer protein/seed storage helical domain-containing protein n=2 Tax=Nelumbo nucifera TaxID=4432 RepID=A0A822YQQ6_NELNU|nr:PREDICTED: lipid transfer-like protein VAS [Nelumbo nucifera]DAD33699.1 TPA_asm: hypothetical protein HUJ06_012550 [Nelumbo nucifera]
MSCSRKSDVGVLVVAVAAILLVGGMQAVEGQDTACATPLLPCANFLNSTTPPETCCQPIRQTVQTQLSCLCNLLNSSLPQSLGLNVTQLLELPKYCGVNVRVSDCIKAQAPSPSASLTPPPPPGVPGSDGNGVSKTAWTGMTSLVLLWTSMFVF